MVTCVVPFTGMTESAPFAICNETRQEFQQLTHFLEQLRVVRALVLQKQTLAGRFRGPLLTGVKKERKRWQERS